jgi:hypothetical protein
MRGVVMNEFPTCSTALRLNEDTSRHEKEIEGPESENGEGPATRPGNDCRPSRSKPLASSVQSKNSV